jgi:hypothetical protein
MFNLFIKQIYLYFVHSQTQVIPIIFMVISTEHQPSLNRTDDGQYFKATFDGWHLRGKIDQVENRSKSNSQPRGLLEKYYLSILCKTLRLLCHYLVNHWNLAEFMSHSVCTYICSNGSKQPTYPVWYVNWKDRLRCIYKKKREWPK